MLMHLVEHRDASGEVNLTSLVEAWDAAQAGGEATLDEHHPAWDVAVEVAERADASEELEDEAPLLCDRCGRYAHGRFKGAGHNRCADTECECYCTRISVVSP
ncbi:hypothetical protein LXT21_44605 [Myxococcus sp. K38C18041901]|uniref:hypothetical protein n=1 Tax=Myxococcus guangdongensis TaxID=2906760 RepID=UPI0020A81E8B|nr:hypothetical protein [Myxococcus guangdongensis]MCP3065867.1 hypothetical protein [Myxococcus guangdongensis]